MKWWLVLLAVVLGVLMTWLLTARRPSRPISTGEPAVSAAGPVEDMTAVEEVAVEEEVAVDEDWSGFGGTPTEPSTSVGAAEAWDSDAEDEDALLPHDGAAQPAAGGAGADDLVPPVAEATPNGDVAGVGEPGAVEAVDSIEVVDPPVGDAPTEQPGKPAQGAFTFDEDVDEDDADADPSGSGRT